MRFVRRLRRIVKLAGFGLMVAAISQEMSKPESDREWHGKVFAVVPYDLRPPTWERIREAYWNPSDPRLFTDRVFGVGWAINLYRAKEYLEETFEGLMGEAKPTGRPARKRAAR